MKDAQEYFKPYEDLLGFCPPRVQERVRMGLEIEPELLDLVERVRNRAMYPKEFDVKTTQLFVFAILLAQLQPGAQGHAQAAVRAGATKAELHALVALAYLFRGMSAFNIGTEIIGKVFESKSLR